LIKHILKTFNKKLANPGYLKNITGFFIKTKLFKTSYLCGKKMPVFVRLSRKKKTAFFLLPFGIFILQQTPFNRSTDQPKINQPFE
jgi:hypothetical protein